MQARGKGNSSGTCVADAKHEPSPLAGRHQGGWGYGEHRLLWPNGLFASRYVVHLYNKPPMPHSS